MSRKRKYFDEELNIEKQNDSEKLKIAVRNGDETNVRRLVKGGVLVNPKSRQWFGSTVLHDAIASGKLPIVKLLLQAKADVNAKTQDNRTCLHIASRTGCSGNTEMVKELINAGADVNVQTKINHKIQESWNLTNKSTFTVNAGADVNVQTKDKRTALHFATWRGNEDIVQLLVSHGANVNSQDEDLWSPLFWAAKLNYMSIAKILVNHGACLNCINSRHVSPLHEVIKNGHMELAKYLIMEGAEVALNSKGIFQLMIENRHIKPADMISLCETLKLTGHLFKENTQVKQILSKSTNMDQDFVTFVQRQQAEVLSLKSLCRICIRNSVIKASSGYSIKKQLLRLPLPKLLQQYVDFR